MKSFLTSSLVVLILLTGHGTANGAPPAPATQAGQQPIGRAGSVTAENIDYTLATLENSGFIESVSISDKSTGVLPQHNIGILQAAKRVKEAATAEEAGNAEVDFSNSMQRSGHRSSVKFVTIRDGKTVHGARVKYHAIGRKRVHAVPQLTIADTPTMLPIGIYYFWTERDGLQTSEQLTISVIQKKQVVDLVENY